jgi:MFS family permease
VTLRRTVLAFYAYRATTIPGFTWPVLTIYLLDQRLSYAAIAAAGAALAATNIAAELPTGYVADRLGRRNALLVGACCFLVADLGFLLVRSPLDAALVYGTLGVAEAFLSGTTGAWLYDALAAHDATEEFTRVSGRAGAVRRWSGAAMMLTAGPLYLFDHRLPFVAMAVLNVLSVGLVLALPRVTRRREHALSIRAAPRVLREHLLKPGMRGFVVFFALYAALRRGVGSYTQPVTVDVLRPLLAGIPPEAVLGVVYAGFTALGALAADRATDAESVLGDRGVLFVLPVVAALALVVPLAVPLAVLPAFFLLRGVTALVAPVRNRFLNERIPSAGRATVLSAASLSFAGVRIPLLLGAGVLADAAGPMVAVAALGGVLLAGAAGVVLAGVPFATARDASVGAD